MSILRSLVIVLLLTLAACGQATDRKSDGNVAALVNGVEITRKQVDFIYKRTAAPNLGEADAATLKRQILADLVRIELFAGKAREMKLDQSQDYAMALYSAQKTVLAGFAENRVTGNPTVSSRAVDIIIKNNPMLFAGRKMYIYDELIISGVDLALLETLNTMANQGASINQLATTLNAKKIPYRLSLKALASENIPQAILVILNGMKTDRPRVINAGGKVSILLSLRYTAPIPLEGEAAKSTARGLLAQNQRSQAMSKAMNDLLTDAKITYYDEYRINKIGDRTLSVLPVPDKEKAERRAFRKHFSEALLGSQIVLAIMALTAMMRALFSKLWLPRIWPNYDVSDEMRGSASDRYKPSWKKLVYLYSMMVFGFGSILWGMVRLYGKLSVWELSGSVIGAVIIGFIASRIFRIGAAMKWSRKTYSIIVGVLTVINVVAVMAIMRMSNF